VQLAKPYGAVLAGARRQRISAQFRRGFVAWVAAEGAAGRMGALNQGCDGLLAHALRFAAVSPATALAFAAALLDAGADPDLESHAVGSPLAAAVWYRMPAVQALLLARGARPACDLPLRLAVRSLSGPACQHTVEQLLAAGVRHAPSVAAPVRPVDGGDVEAQMRSAVWQHSALGHALLDKKKAGVAGALRAHGAALADVDFFPLWGNVADHASPAKLRARWDSDAPRRRRQWTGALARRGLSDGWLPAQHWSFPCAFRRAARLLLLHANTPRSPLPAAIWQRLLGHLDRFAVHPPLPEV
jgi:hypothetical protein